MENTSRVTAPRLPMPIRDTAFKSRMSRRLLMATLAGTATKTGVNLRDAIPSVLAASHAAERLFSAALILETAGGCVICDSVGKRKGFCHARRFAKGRADAASDGSDSSVQGKTRRPRFGSHPTDLW